MSAKTSNAAPLAVTSAFDELRKEFGEWLDAAEATAATQDKIEKLTTEEQALTEEIIAGLAERRDRIVQLLARAEAEEELEKKLAAHHERRARRFRRMGEWIKFSIKTVMEMKGWKRVEGNSSVLQLQNNQPSVAILNIKDVPDSFCHFEKIPEKEKIKDALLAGEEVPGCALVTDRRRLDVS